MKIVINNLLMKIKKYEKQKKLIGYIIDLRNNPGGLIKSSNKYYRLFSRRWRNCFYKRKKNK